MPLLRVSIKHAANQLAKINRLGSYLSMEKRTPHCKPTVGAMLSLAVIAASLAWQGRCHRGEPERPEPFSGPAEAVVRILLEQWITFPRFVFSGGWTRALREASR
ncbi:hypothetical protein [Burkholderia sp. ABCPW 14]|uniref:hypothetical protein n=1 Tax=Burkholderia sp. ABCPW 14 TaxID=1637860 RepID=UPI003FA41B0B